MGKEGQESTFIYKNMWLLDNSYSGNFPREMKNMHIHDRIVSYDCVSKFFRLTLNFKQEVHFPLERL